MAQLGPAHLQRAVPAGLARAERRGPAPPQVQGVAGDPQLGEALVGPGQQGLGLERPRRRRGPLAQLGQQGAAEGEVDRAAVVGVDQRQVDELVALVDVGHARQREGQGLLGQGVDPAVGRQRPHEGLDLVDQPRVAEHGLHPGVAPGVEVVVGLGPRRADLGLLRRLGHERHGPLGVDRPRPHQRLEQEVLGRLRRAAEPGHSLADASIHRSQAPAHTSGTSDSRASRARTSAERLVSCVDRAVIVSGQVACTRTLTSWNSSSGSAEAPGVAAHLVERQQAGEAVEGRVLHALGHRRPAELLEPHGELVLERRGAVHPGQQQVGQERQQVGVDVVAADADVGHGLDHAGGVGRPHQPRLGPHVGAVDGERDQQLAHGLGQLVAGAVALLAAGLAHLDEQGDEAGHVGRQDLPHHHRLGLDHHGVPVGRRPGERPVGRGQRALPVGVDEHARRSW